MKNNKNLITINVEELRKKINNSKFKTFRELSRKIGKGDDYIAHLLGTSSHRCHENVFDDICNALKIPNSSRYRYMVVDMSYEDAVEFIDEIRELETVNGLDERRIADYFGMSTIEYRVKKNRAKAVCYRKNVEKRQKRGMDYTSDMRKKKTIKNNVICKRRYGIIWNTPAMLYDFGDEHKFSSMEIGVKLNPGDKYRADYDGRNDVWIIGNYSLMFKMKPETFANLFDFIENEEKND